MPRHAASQAEIPSGIGEEELKQEVKSQLDKADEHMEHLKILAQKLDDTLSVISTLIRPLAPSSCLAFFCNCSRGCATDNALGAAVTRLSIKDWSWRSRGAPMLGLCEVESHSRSMRTEDGEVSSRPSLSPAQRSKVSWQRFIHSS